MARVKQGMTVKGKVVRLEKFGAFIEIGAERPGLIHISELAHGYVRTPAEIVSEGDEVEAQVLDVNRRKKQIKLSLKALQPEPVKVEEPARMAEVAPKERSNRRRRSGKPDQANSDNDTSTMPEAQAAIEADPTAMEIALREAMEKSKNRKGYGADRYRHDKSASREAGRNPLSHSGAQGTHLLISGHLSSMRHKRLLILHPIWKT